VPYEYEGYLGRERRESVRFSDERDLRAGDLVPYEGATYLVFRVEPHDELHALIYADWAAGGAGEIATR
jgi:hypothetical protein